MRAIIPLLLIYCFLFQLPGASAQEETTAIYQGKRYLDLNIRSLNKYNKRVEGQQQRLLNKLSRKEKRYADKLKCRDSAAYARYQLQPITFDSIRRLRKPDSTSLHGKTSRSPNAAIDSLKGVQRFIEDKAHVVGEPMNVGLNGYDTKLNQQNAKLNYNQYINDLISQRIKNLKAINNGSKAQITAFKNIYKKVFYSKSKTDVFRQMNDEPSKAEEKALEYLQGTEGFDKYLKNSNSVPDLSGKSTADLEKMGYQTKHMLNAQLQNKLGSGMSAVQQNMGKQVQQWQDQTKKLSSAKTKVSQGKNQLKQTKSSLRQTARIDKPAFKVNPMRGLPFSKRIEKQCNWQTTRATIDGRPAVFQLAVMAGFKHSPKLTYGVGLATSIGLGQNWNNIHISFEGISARTYANWQWQYGIGAYAGYERTFKQASFFTDKDITGFTPNQHNTKTYSETLLIGLTKSYRINDKWSGSLQVFYDVWWKDKGLRSPVILRFATMKI